ncbi:MAG: manganese efflux pump, partial [Mobilitalea sp.]
MDYTTLFLLALGLSADAFAVAITNGIYHNQISKKECLLTGLTFGLFQGLMPIIGYFLGSTFSDVLNNYHHWIAFFLLGAIGINMVTEAIKERKNPEAEIEAVDIFAPKNLTLQGIATASISASGFFLSLIASVT